MPKRVLASGYCKTKSFRYSDLLLVSSATRYGVAGSVKQL